MKHASLGERRANQRPMFDLFEFGGCVHEEIQSDLGADALVDPYETFDEGKLAIHHGDHVEVAASLDGAASERAEGNDERGGVLHQPRRDPCCFSTETGGALAVHRQIVNTTTREPRLTVAP